VYAGAVVRAYQKHGQWPTFLGMLPLSASLCWAGAEVAAIATVWRKIVSQPVAVSGEIDVRRAEGQPCRRPQGVLRQDRQGQCHPFVGVLHNIITATPSTPCKPHLWKWDQMWPWIQEAGRLITAKEAERAFWCWKPRATRPLEHYPQPLRRTAAHSPREVRPSIATPNPPCAHLARQGCLHRGGR